MVCWAKLGSSTGVSKSRYENEEVLLLHRAPCDSTDLSTWKNSLFNGEKYFGLSAWPSVICSYLTLMPVVSDRSNYKCDNSENLDFKILGALRGIF